MVDEMRELKADAYEALMNRDYWDGKHKDIRERMQKFAVKQKADLQKKEEGKEKEESKE